MRTTAYLLLLSSAALLLTLLAGCDEGFAPTRACEPEPEPDTALAELTPLVFADAWTPTRREHDPLVEHRPATVICPGSAWGEEFGVFEVNTAGCNYLSVEQPLAAAIAVGDPLRVQLWWQTLFASEPAIGHVAVSIDDLVVWEIEVEIPGPADARALSFESPIAAEPGATVGLHVHNHGANSWTVAEFARVGSRGDDCE